jgi:hypothetical protein
VESYGRGSAFGIDLTQIPGIRTGIAQTLFGEIGPGLYQVPECFRICLLDGPMPG